MGLYYNMFSSVLTSDGLRVFDGLYPMTSVDSFGTIIPSFAKPSIDITADISTGDISGTVKKENFFPLYMYNRPILQYDTFKNSRNNLNNSPTIRNKMTKYFFDKLKYSWLENYFTDLYRYLRMTEGIITYVKSSDDYDTSTDYREQKARFIISTIFEKIDMEALLEKYVKKHRVNWFDLKSKHARDIREYVHEKIEKHMINRIRKL